MTLAEAKAEIGIDELFGLVATSEQRLLVLPLVSKHPANTGSEYVVIKPPYIKGWQIMFAYPDSKHIPTYLQENAVRYATIPTADFQDYTQKPVSEAALEPMSAFFIQAQSSGSLVFATTNKILKPSSGTKHSPASQINVDARIRLTGNNRSDQTYLLIGEDFTDAPDFNADLPKMFGIAPKIYSIYGGDSLASLALPTELAGEVIPLGMQIGEAGQYTFSLTENSTIQGIERLDLIDGQTVVADLLQDDYTVQLSAGEIERFRLRAVLPNTNPSELEHDASNDLDDVRKYIVNQHVVIERNGDKYDVLGRTIK